MHSGRSHQCFWLLATAAASLVMSPRPGDLSRHLFSEDAVQVARDVFVLKGISRVVALVCSREEGVLLGRSLGAGLQVMVHRACGLPDTASLLRADRVGVLVYSPCRAVLDAMRQCSSSFKFNSTYHWLVMDSKEVRQILPDLNLAIDTEMILTQHEVDRIVLLDVHKMNHSFPLQIVPAGEWFSPGHVNMTRDPRITWARRDLTGLLLRTVVLLSRKNIGSLSLPELFLLPPHEAQGMDAFAMFSQALHRNVEALYNFTSALYAARKVEDQGSDGLYSPETTLGMFQRGVVDYSSTVSVQYPHRMEVAEFTGPIWPYRTRFMFLNVGSLGSLDALTSPLGPSAWMAVIALFLLGMPLMRLVSWWEVRIGEAGLRPAEDNSWSSVFVSAVGTSTGQGFLSTSYWFSGRQLFFALELFFFLLGHFYAMTIVTFLLRDPPQTVRSTVDLIISPYAVGCEDWYFHRITFSTQRDAIIRDLYRRKMEPSQNNGFMDGSLGVERMRYSRFAFYDDEQRLFREVRKQKFTSREICSLAQVSLIPDLLVAPYMRKPFPFREFFVQGLLRQREVGILRRETQIWRERRPPCTDRHTVQSVEVRPVIPALAILTLGVMAAFCVMILERTRSADAPRDARRQTPKVMTPGLKCPNVSSRPVRSLQFLPTMNV